MVLAKLRVFSIVLLLLSAAGGDAVSAQDPAYLTEYRGYNAALEAGDAKEAAARALAAWQAAERELGDHQTTAVLAFNYGQHVMFDEPSAAKSAFLRADELAKNGLASLDTSLLDVYLAYVILVDGKARWDQAATLQKALKAYSENGGAPSLETVRIKLDLAIANLDGERFDDALAIAVETEDEIGLVAPSDIHGRAMAAIVGGAASLLPLPRETFNISRAHRHFNRALNLFAPQSELESFDPVFATAYAWDATAHAALLSAETEEAAEKIMADWDFHPQILAGGMAPEECEAFVSVARKPPHYPTRAAAKTYIGAVLVGYHISRRGEVEAPRILAEVPGSIFGARSLQSMEQWRFDVTENAPEACLRNRVSTFTFIMSKS